MLYVTISLSSNARDCSFALGIVTKVNVTFIVKYVIIIVVDLSLGRT